MGVGRRMKKQGPPPPLDEATISLIKKRKAAEAGAKADGGKKRRKAVAESEPEPEPETQKVKTKGDKTKSNGVTVNGKNGKEQKSAVVATPKKTPTKAEKSKKSAKKVSEPEPASEDDDDDESWGSGSAPDLDELMQDEFGDLDDVSDTSGGSDVADGKFDEGSVFDSEEEDHPREKMFSDDEDESDAEEKLTAANIEGLSRKLDEQRQMEEEEARQEMQDSALQTNIAGERPDIFGDADTAAKAGIAPNMQLLRTRITDTLRVLGDLATLGQPGQSRADYMQLLLDDICTYYGYTPYLAEKLMSLFTPMEAFAFFEANEIPRPVVIRTNTLRTNRRTLAQALINRGVVLQPVGKWSKVGLQVFESAVPLGATPEYLAGHYILQAASSFLPVMALAPQENERVLDMASAPGGKTTYISALMRNTGIVVANDASKARTKGLIGNIHRLGCKNTIVCNYNAQEAFPKILGGFDRVLLDAPCTGTGVISKDPSVKTNKTERDFLAIPHLQRQLLLAAIDSTDHHSKTGGYIVYSTCSVTVEENEQVVQYVLRKRPNVKIVDTGLGSFGSEGFTSYMGKKFDEKMTLTRRYFPHRENVDGFFVCKLKKTGPSPGASKKNGVVADETGDTKSNKSASEAGDNDAEIIDKTPIMDENGNAIGEDAFGPFEEEEDAEIIARAERNRLRRKGINPKAVLEKARKDGNKAKKQDSTSDSASEKEPSIEEQGTEKKKGSKKEKKSTEAQEEKSAVDATAAAAAASSSPSSTKSKKTKKSKK
ncbi:nucleolar RNA methyltransferase (Nop2), putative [Talaromyces stipitatus ATCC 10500]|uniref:Nucleolar protein 2 n=1 Tax=Talaromyces stipitatus (strain ATCC 10500 / CBS 375.48 / QM 6759 / NRRL 1006) TaxID=441959 RepID=B8LWV2_TALSN|nr:S-adenosylmethionine-dependent methyltransferase superfamily domain-containing protein [Talaromyces stipitatus ATCC 10500]EED24585.1 nucleolar RNA methyltransferase (Nop2), putative [Talaromyces stipitatus ATCC 10500]